MRSIIIVDWRGFGDFSAVGQLTKKIFANVAFESFRIIHIKVNGFGKDNTVDISCWCNKTNKLSYVYEKINPDAALLFLKNERVDLIYGRLSPSVNTLEFLSKCVKDISSDRFFIHYMDKPELENFSLNKRFYIESLYNFLIRRAGKCFVIENSVIGDFEKLYSKESYALGNFISSNRYIPRDIVNEPGKPIRIHYYGSIDRKMNEAALLSFIKVVRFKPWIKFYIWTNSGVYGEIKSLLDEASNIIVSSSNLNEADYKDSIDSADCLMLAYNFTIKAKKFLSHSFSNKVIDYLEVGKPLIYLGPMGIPTAMFLEEHRLGILIDNVSDVENFFTSKENVVNCFKKSIASELAYQKIFIEKKSQYEIFVNFASITNSVNPTVLNDFCVKDNYSIDKYLNLFIRYKYFDNENNSQSLAASLMSKVLKSKGYKGFDYEI